MYANEVTIPAAFYDECYSKNIAVPQDQEIRHKGKGKQYVISRTDENFAPLLRIAKHEYEAGNPHAENFLRSLSKQGVSVGVDLPEREAKPVTRKTKAIGDRRNLIVTITPDGDLILRPAGRRKSISISLSTVYTLAVNAEARKAIAVAKAARKERKAQRRVERDAAVLAFKANPSQITLR